MIGFSYNGTHSSTYDIVAKSVNRPLLPALRKREFISPAMHGAYDLGDNQFDKKYIEVDLKYIGTSFTELRTRARTIAYWLSGYGNTKILYFDDEPDKFYDAKIYNDIGLQNFFKVGQTKLIFECDPYAYSSAISTADELYSGNSTIYITSNGTVETSPLIEIEGRILSTFSASFTRASVAYKQDGTQVASGEVRYETGLCDQGIMIEEGIPPLVQNDFFTAYTGTIDDDTEDTFTNWTNWTDGTGRVEAVSDSAFGGVAVKVVQTAAPGAINYQGSYQERTLAAMGLVAGDGLSLQARYKMSAQVNTIVNIHATCYDDAYDDKGSFYLVSYATAAVSNYIQVKLENQTIPAGTTRIRFQAYIRSTGAYAGQNNWLIVDYFTCEKKAYCTSPTDVTRAAEVLTRPVSFVKGNMSEEFTFIPTSTLAITGKIGFLWECYIDATNYYRLLVHDTGRLYLEINSTGGYTNTYNAGDPVLVVGAEHRLWFKMNGTTMCHGVGATKGLAGDVAYTEPVGSLPANEYLGSNQAGTTHANGIYDEWATSSIARTDASLAARGVLTTALPVDEYTTGKMDCDNNLTIYGAVPGVTGAVETDAENPTITIGTASITYSGVLTYDEKLTINMDKMQMYIGASNALGGQSGDFLNLEPGENTVTYSDDGSNRANVTVTYTNKWI